MPRTDNTETASLADFEIDDQELDTVAGAGTLVEQVLDMLPGGRASILPPP
jgi:hypothetical protein